MNRLNQLLAKMHQTSNKKFIAAILILLIMITCTGCNVKKIYSNGAWLTDLARRSGVSLETDFNRIIDDLVAYEVIDNEPINRQEPLTYEYMAFTLSNLIGNPTIKDCDYVIAESKYVKQIKNIIALKIYENDDKYFKSHQKVPKTIALSTLDKAINLINHQTFERHAAYAFDEDVIKINENTDFQQLQAGQKVIDDNGDVFKIAFDDGNPCLEPIAPICSLKDLEISDDRMIDFNDAYIEDLYDIKEETSIYQDEKIQRQAFKITDPHHIEFDGYKASYFLNPHGIHIYLSKQTERGLNFFWDSEINNVKPTYHWKYQDHKLESAYFKLFFNTNQAIGFKQAKYRNLYGNLTDVKQLKLNNFFKKAEDTVAKEITLFKVHVPIEGVPSAEIVLAVKLNFYISGRVEAVLDTENGLGFEVRNGHLRFINEHQEDLDVVLGANASASLNLDVMLKALKMNLMNVGTRAGIRGEVKTTFHAYDSDGRIISYPSDIEYDLAEEISNVPGKPLYVCGDLSLHWLLDIDINQAKTLAGQMGFGKTWHLLSNKNQIFNNLTHIEHGVFKEKCSYLDREQHAIDAPTLVTDQLILSEYAIVLKQRHQIKIKGMPEHYSLKDINYISEDSKIATVDENGLIRRVSPGVTKIKIQTTDGRYQVVLNVLVSDLDE